MYHSLTITDDKMSVNTYDTWFLAPTSRPSFSPPDFKINTIEIPGRNGLLDVTTALTKFPTFGDRVGNIEFLIHPDSPYDWVYTYQIVANHIHGQKKRLSLEDDPAYWYEGRLWLNDFVSDKTYSTITVEYELSPYKKSKWTTLENWDYDPFGLDDGQKVYDWFKDLSVDATDYWVDLIDSISGMFPNGKQQDMLGQGLTIPTIKINSYDGNGIDILFINEELDINYRTHMSDGDHVDDSIIFSMQYMNNWLRLSAKGHGTVSVEYNIRSL